MNNQPSNSQSYATCQPPTGRSVRNSSATRHHMRNVDCEIEILSTAQVIAHAEKILQVAKFPAADLDALASGYVDVWNSACPDAEVGLSGRLANDLIGELVGYAFMLTRVEADAEGV